MKFRTLKKKKKTTRECSLRLLTQPISTSANGLHIYELILRFAGPPVSSFFITMYAPFDSRPNRTNKLICTTNLSKHLGSSPSSTPSFPWLLPSGSLLWMRLLRQEGVCGDSLGNTYLKTAPENPMDTPKELINAETPKSAKINK